MFVLVLLDIFQQYYKNPNDPIFIFKRHLLQFRIKYTQYLQEKKISKIRLEKVLDFLRYLTPPLGSFLLTKRI